MKSFISGFRVFAISVALAFSVYGHSAQFIHSLLVNVQYQSDYLGWGFLFLMMSHLVIVLPASLCALITIKFKYNPPHIWLGKYGRKIIMAVMGLCFVAGTLLGWPS